MFDLIDVSQSKVVFGLRFIENDGGPTGFEPVEWLVCRGRSSTGRHRLCENALKRLESGTDGRSARI